MGGHPGGGRNAGPLQGTPTGKVRVLARGRGCVSFLGSRRKSERWFGLFQPTRCCGGRRSVEPRAGQKKRGKGGC